MCGGRPERSVSCAGNCGVRSRDFGWWRAPLAVVAETGGSYGGGDAAARAGRRGALRSGIWKAGAAGDGPPREEREEPVGLRTRTGGAVGKNGNNQNPFAEVIDAPRSALV